MVLPPSWELDTDFDAEDRDSGILIRLVVVVLGGLSMITLECDIVSGFDRWCDWL